jgi:hypothetical protein
MISQRFAVEQRARAIPASGTHSSGCTALPVRDARWQRRSRGACCGSRHAVRPAPGLKQNGMVERDGWTSANAAAACHRRRRPRRGKR